MLKKQIKLLLCSLLIALLMISCSDIQANLSLNTTSIDSAINITDGSIVVHFIDVGQGDAQLIHNNGVNTLIDTGEKSESEELLHYLKELGVEHIDNLILTHPHTDHMGGATVLMEEFSIGQVYMTNYVHTTKAYSNLITTIKDKNIPRTQAKAGVTVDMGDDITATILSPNKDYKDINASSIVLKVEYGKTSFLFTGDAIKKTEKDILANDYDVSATVLKVSHHGSDTSNSMDFLAAVNPEISIIEVGEGNSYGHPHDEIIKFLNQLNTTILRTDQLGTIIITSDGSDITVK